jgi:DeoR/GlpR family transcriptional regulator of sugar metabolism
MIIGTLLALIGILVGVIMTLMVGVQSTTNSIKVDLKNLQIKLETQQGFPSSHQFLTVLAREAKFWEKLNIQRSDKILISQTIASEYIQDNSIIIIDSGTTVDQIPQILKEKKTKVIIYTNNLLAAISVVPIEIGEGFECFLLSGRIDPIFGALYNVPKIEEPLKTITANQIILAAMAISFEEGPMISAADYSNLKFKKELIRKVLEDKESPRLLIAVDYTKLHESIVKKENDDLNTVLDQSTWKAIKSNKQFVLVTTMPLDSLKTPNAIIARKIINKFYKNMETGGMQIRICNINS